MRIIKTADYNEMSKTAANIIAAQMILTKQRVRFSNGFFSDWNIQRIN